MTAEKTSLLRMCLVLFIVALVAAVGLALVFEVTAQPIENARQRKKNETLFKVLPDFHGDFKSVGILPAAGEDSVMVHLAFVEDSLAGAAVETYTDKGFGGNFYLMVGFDREGNILGSEVLKSSETPGLGDNIKSDKSDFAKQFVSKNPQSFKLKVKKDGGDVNAITAATISSRAYCDALERAYHAYLMVKEKYDE